MPESLITDEARAQLGKVQSRASGVADLLQAQRWAAAVGDRNPIYFDEAAAKAAGYKGIVCPPLYLPTVVGGVIDLDNMREDGLPLSRGNNVPLRVNRLMYGGQEMDFLEPVYPGDRIEAETRLASLEEKEGSKGPFVLTTNETVYTNQDGKVVARARAFSIAR